MPATLHSSILQAPVLRKAWVLTQALFALGLVVAASAESWADETVEGATLSPTTPAEADGVQSGQPAGQHCYGECRRKLLIWQGVIGQTNPLGIAHLFTLSLCIPLIRKPGLLFDYTNLELGLVNYLTPVEVRQGVLVSLTPLSFLQVKIEVTGGNNWSVPELNWGYVALDGYDADFSDAAREHATYGSSWGFTAGAGATLKGQITLSANLALLAFDSAELTYWHFGNAPYWYNSFYDLILAADDMLVRNTAAVLIEIGLGRTTDLLIGPMDDLVSIPQAGYLANIASGFAQVRFEDVGEEIDINPFVRMGAYTNHAFREGLMVLLGFEAFYGLWSGQP